MAERVMFKRQTRRQRESRRVILRNLRLRDRYEVTPFEADATVIFGKERGGTPAVIEYWRSMVLGRYEGYVLPVDHQMMRASEIRPVADQVRCCLLARTPLPLAHACP